MHWLIPLSFMVLAELVANYIAKRWSLEGGPFLFLVAITGFVVVNVFWLFALRYGVGLSRGAMYFGISSAVLASVLGVVHFHEALSLLQWLGIFLGLVAMILLR